MPRVTWLTQSKMPLYTRRSSTSSWTHGETCTISKQTEAIAKPAAEREVGLPQILSLLSEASLSSSTAWSWTQSLDDQRWHTHGSPAWKQSIHSCQLQTVSLLHTHTHTVFLTRPGSTGANHMCLPSWVQLTPSINLSGVLTSPLTLSSTFTLSGKAAMSGGRNVEVRSCLLI